MGRIPEDTIHEIRNRVDIVDLVGRYIELKRAGRNFKGLCPFHGEKSPSFNVNPDRQIYHCFGCGEGGNAISFVMAHDNLTFPEATRMLAREVGIEIPETGNDSAARGVSEQIYEANDVAQALYQKALRSPEAEGAREYLKRRGLTGEQVVELGVGYAPDRWDAVANELRQHKTASGASIPGEIAVKAGLVAERDSGGYYDRLRGRVTFPILDVRGRVLGFGARALAEGQEPKYLNTPETPVFKKREALYGFPNALEAIRRTGRAILCEGYFDRIALYRAGIGEGLATCGTALTREHARQLHRRTKEVVLLFDGDAAGQKAVERALETLLPEGLRVRVVTLPGGQDPDDYLAAHGADALRDLVDKAEDALDGVIRRVTAQGCSTPAAKADAVDHLGPLVALVPNAVERESYVDRLALAVGAPVTAVASVVRGGKNRREEVEEIAAGPAVAHINDALRGAYEQLTRALLQRPEVSAEALGAQLEEVLPETLGWKELTLALAHAPLDAAVDDAGEIDVHRVAAVLSPEAGKLLASVVASDVPWPEGLEARAEIEGLLVHFAERRRREQAEQLQEQIRRNPDDPALLQELSRLQRERRNKVSSTHAALGVSS